MTSPSKREIEQRFDDLDTSGPPSSLDEAIFQAFEKNKATATFRFRWEGDRVADTEIPEEYVAAGIGETFVWHISPEWLPSDTAHDDLPLALDDCRVRFAEVST
jgi:hypothetical protein